MSPTGVWVVVYRDRILNGADLQDLVLVVRSTDHGRTWSAPLTITPLPPSAYSEATPLVATDGNGRWVVAWTTTLDLGGSDGDDADIVASRSSDDGLTWSAPSIVNSDALDAGDAATRFPRKLVFGPSGTVVLTWMQSPNAESKVTRSLDGGATWSAFHTVTATGIIDSQLKSGCGVGGLAAGPGGRWMLAWGTIDYDLAVATSDDDAATWSAPTIVGADVGAFYFDCESVATDGTGTWIVQFSSGTLLSEQNAAFSDPDQFGLRSDDDGATWSTPFPIDVSVAQTVRFNADLEPTSPNLVYDPSADLWVASWSRAIGPFVPSGLFRVALHAVSRDGGVTWAPPARVVPYLGRAQGPIGEQRSRLEADGAGRFGFLTFGGAVSPAGDPPSGNPPLRVYPSLPDCPSTPAATCKGLGTTGKSTIKIRSNLGPADSLKWKWVRGEATSPAELGDPATTDRYALCVYETSAATPHLVLEKDVPPAAQCSGRPCWDVGADRLRYKDSRESVGAVRKVDLRPGPTGKTKIRLLAKRAALGPPALPLSLDPEAAVQLHNLTNGSCWEARYTSAKKPGDTERFTAKAD